MRTFFLCGFFLCSSLTHAAVMTYHVTNTMDMGPGSFREALTSVTTDGDVITFDAGGVGTITLMSSLPANQHSITIENVNASPVIINGGGSFQAFSFVQGTTTITNVETTNCLSKGGDGGEGGRNAAMANPMTVRCGGGGGGAGAGGALYLHAGANVSVTNMIFTGNKAQGGKGGDVSTSGPMQPCFNWSGAGGGGFGGGAGGDNKIIAAPCVPLGGGGGGGNTNGGAGGDNGTKSGGNGGDLGGGGGGGLTTGGTSNGQAGGMASADLAGGGAGAGGNGKNGSDGGGGGDGLGSDKAFGGGGGGGAIKEGVNGGPGFGTGGGGTGFQGGAGGTIGGGGGGGYSTMPKNTQGGNGGFGGGGGGGVTAGKGGAVKPGVLAGGDGGDGTGQPYVTAGGGGAAFGGAIYLAPGSSLILSGTTQFSMNDVVGGLGGTAEFFGGSANGKAGGALSKDIFIATGASLIFNHINTISLDDTVDSDEGHLGGACSSKPGLTMQGTGTLFLNPPVGKANTYSCGTAVLGGVLRADRNSSFGVLSYGLTLGTGGTLQFIGTDTISRSILLSGGDGGIDVSGGNTLTLTGAITGTGALFKKNSGTLLLKNSNSYSGGTKIATAGGILQGDTNSLQGDIAFEGLGGTLLFDQPFEGTYGGHLSGPGILQKKGSEILHVTADSSGFNGKTQLLQGELNLTGSLANGTQATVSVGATLSGTGTIGSTSVPLMNSGTIRPGNQIGTLTISGSLIMASSSLFDIEVGPTTHDLLAVTGMAMLDGTLQVSFETDSGFMGFSNTVTILTAGGGRVGAFYPVINTTPSNFFPFEVIYKPKEVEIFYRLINPFIYCSIPFKNERIVAENLAALNVAGAIPEGSPIHDAFQSLAGQSCDVVNEALDECHPAPYSGFSEFQAVVGSKILSAFQRRPVPVCCCNGPRKIWAEPFGAWLDQDSRGEQVGFNANAKGVAVGIDSELSSTFIVGIGGVWNRESLTWKKHRGDGHVEGYYGAFYADYFNESNYVGAAVVGGFDYFDVSRHISFIGLNADTSYRALDIMARLSAAHFFGSSLIALYPYVNLDLLYLKQDGFTEHHAPGFDLDVRENERSTLRTELGVTIQSQDRNNNGNFCFSPLISGAWVMEYPLQRDIYTANFAHQSIPFQVKGWDHTWQIFLMRFGIDITYKCFSLSSSYSVEMSSGDFLGQKGDVRFEWNF